MTLETLFAEHLKVRDTRLSEALSATDFETLVLSSGEPYVYFSDDEEAPFRSVDHFSHWCPAEGPHHVVLLVPGQRPRLVRYAPEDYWYAPSAPGEPYWLGAFEIVEAASVDAVWEAVGTLPRAAYIGNEAPRAERAGLTVNPDELRLRLDWDRAYKTDYELHCLDEASALAAKGHVAAKAAFEAGRSELEIHYAFVQALELSEHELPYQTIVALDEKAAYLHYHAKRRERGQGRVLLIDAGAPSRGYASDITRTHVSPSCDARFVALRDGVEAFQRRLCDAVRPGIPYADLHQQAHLEVAALLAEADVLRGDPRASVDDGLTTPFFPHGLGHHLGLQVHDVGGHQAGVGGGVVPPPEAHPFLRNTRRIEPRHVFTIEPGLYFIDMLLRPHRSGPHRARFNWALIDELAPFGGIRIEDNVVVTDEGHRNLTRPHFAQPT